MPLSNDVDIEIYEPRHHAYTSTVKDKQNQQLTKPRALIIALADRYNIQGFDISHLEIQKLAYFIQEFGQKDLRLQFEKEDNGPSATNTKHLIAHLEGIFFKGQIRF